MNRFYKWLGLLICLLAVLALAGCPTKPPQKPPTVRSPETLKPTDLPPERLGDDLDRAGLETAIKYSLAYLKKLPPERNYRIDGQTVTAAGLVESVEHLARLLDRYGPGPEFHQAVSRDFAAFSPEGEVLFTGYYEPTLEGRRQPEGRFSYPLYGRPKDLIVVNLKDFGLEPKVIRGRVKGTRLKPYPDRTTIDGGALKDRDLEIAYVDKIDAFFLHIQGSGKIVLPGDEVIRVNYADQNGRDYSSLGRAMIKQGLMAKEEVTLQSLKQYLRDHPDQVDDLLSVNQSYVFFRTRTGPGPLGCFGQPVTPYRSVALDRKVYPPAAPVFLETDKPIIENGAVVGWEPLKRLALIQDTGGAIKGPLRADLFCGGGPLAELTAGAMKQRGRLTVLIKKTVLRPGG